MFKNKKIALIGGGGLRTPLLVHGLANSNAELALFDIDRPRLELIAPLCREITDLKIRTPERIEDAVEGADFVISSLRVGGIAARARDERIANQHGFRRRPAREALQWRSGQFRSRYTTRK